MLKKLLNSLICAFSFDNDRKGIEIYLSKSSNRYDLDQRVRELDQKGKYNQFYK